MTSTEESMDYHTTVEDLKAEIEARDETISALRVELATTKSRLEEMQQENFKFESNSLREAMDVATTTLSPSTTKLFKAVFEHARKIHSVKVKVEADRCNIEAWRTLSALLSRPQYVDENADVWRFTSPYKIYNSLYTNSRCLSEVVEIDPQSSGAWFDLGQSLNEGEGIANVGGTSYTKVECCLKAIEFKEDFGDAWCSLATLLETNATASVNKVSYNKLTCCLRALEIDPESKLAWVLLGDMCREYGTIPFKGHSYTPIESYRKALAIDKLYPRAWDGLYRVLDDDNQQSIDVDEHEYTRKECLDISTTLESYSAVEKNPGNRNAWKQLVSVLFDCDDAVKKITRITLDSCVQKTPLCAEMWNELATHLVLIGLANGDASVLINGICYTARACCIRALEVDPVQFATAYNNMGIVMAVDESIFISGSSYTQKDCYIKALEINPCHYQSYINLGNLITGDETVVISGRPHTRKECYLKALEINPCHYQLYFYLGNMLACDETIFINGTTYTDKECYIKALEISPCHYEVFLNLGTTLTDDETIFINGSPYTQKDCYIKAIEMDPHVSFTYTYLGDIMDEGETAIINGTTYTKEECYTKAAEIEGQ